MKRGCGLWGGRVTLGWWSDTTWGTPYVAFDAVCGVRGRRWWWGTVCVRWGSPLDGLRGGETEFLQAMAQRGRRQAQNCRRAVGTCNTAVRVPQDIRNIGALHRVQRRPGAGRHAFVSPHGG